jgi:hypothetical protein
MKTGIFEIAILLMLAGCVSINEDNSRAIGEAVGEGFGHIIKDHQSLLYSVVWYYRANEKWPETREDLLEFIELHKAPIDLSKFTTIEFCIDEKGDLEIDYTLEYKNVKREDIGINIKESSLQGTFRITKEDALNIDFAVSEYLRECL